MIETNRLIIRKFNEDDCLELYDYLLKEEIYEFEPGEPVDLEEAKKLACERAAGDNFYAVELKCEGKLIGHLYFDRHSRKELMLWELGYIFNPKYQRKGYCSEAARAMVEYAFNDMGAHRVVAHCNPLNIASNRVLQKIGMKHEGTLRSNIFFHRDEEGNPKWCDTNIYAMLKEDL
jgi:RimJ/RimL family protein N-acetyltransferase